MAELMSVTFAESAIEDLEAIRDYYCEQEVPEVGERFMREILDLVESLTNHPDRGRIVPEFNQSFLRELIHPPFRIVYKRKTHGISVVRVWRSERLLKLP
jgi:plasmid stabilization system protein ParE